MGTFIQMVNATALIPMSETVDQQKYLTISGRIKFKPGKTGALNFICPFPTLTNDRVQGGGITMILRYARELEAAQASISVALRRYNLITGSVGDILKMDTDSENPQGRSGNDNERKFAKITAHHDRAIDTTKYGYYFRINMRRKTIRYSQPSQPGGTTYELNVAILDLQLLGSY